MEIIPSIDLKNGRVVRLRKGNPDAKTEYAEDAVALAQKYAALGATRLHVIDLDEAFGTGNNLTLIRDILAVPRLRVQVGGGVRNARKTRELLDLGADRVIVGTAAQQPDLLSQILDAADSPPRVWASCDIKDGKMATHGWVATTDNPLIETLEAWKTAGVGGMVVSDVSRDGTGNGIQKTFFENVRKLTTLPLIAAGGVTTPNDLAALHALDYQGAIIGKALYEPNSPLNPEQLWRTT